MTTDTTTTNPLACDASDEVSRIGAEIACVGSLIGQASHIDHPEGLQWLLSGWARSLRGMTSGVAAEAQS